MLTPTVARRFASAGMLAPAGRCRTWDARRRRVCARRGVPRVGARAVHSDVVMHCRARRVGRDAGRAQRQPYRSQRRRAAVAARQRPHRNGPASPPRAAGAPAPAPRSATPSRRVHGACCARAGWRCIPAKANAGHAEPAAASAGMVALVVVRTDGRAPNAAPSCAQSFPRSGRGRAPERLRRRRGAPVGVGVGVAEGGAAVVLWIQRLDLSRRVSRRRRRVAETGASSGVASPLLLVARMRARPRWSHGGADDVHRCVAARQWSNARWRATARAAAACVLCDGVAGTGAVAPRGVAGVVDGRRAHRRVDVRGGDRGRCASSRWWPRAFVREGRCCTC